MRRLVIFIVLLMALTACSGGDAPATDAPSVALKVLVTVEIPPTLSVAEQLATQQAAATPTPPPPTLTPTATPYVGVFIGEANPAQGGAPLLPQDVTAQPTENVGLCVLSADPAFGEVWQRDPSVARQMGCAIQERFGFDGKVQVFERGVMYLRSSTNEVWAVSPGRISGGRYWYTNQIPVAGGGIGLGLPAPQEGQRVPADTFGAVWGTNPPIQQAIGYAITPEQTADLNIQRFDGGTLFLDVTVGQVFVLLVNGDAYGPFGLD